MAQADEVLQAGDISALFAVLSRNWFPIDGLRDHLATALVAREDGGVIGSAALECYCTVALLRSIAVVVAQRGQGLGERLTRSALDLAQAQGITEFYPASGNGAGLLPRFGFHAIPRQAVAPAAWRSVAWTSACPVKAQAMMTTLHLQDAENDAGG
jgi:amino-acid N-acetyltransferase